MYAETLANVTRPYLVLHVGMLKISIKTSHVLN